MLEFKIVIAEDHTLLRQGLRSLLADEPHLQIVAEAEDGIQAIRSVEKHGADLLLLDISMPRMNGISVIHDLKSRYPEIKILVLTVHKDDEYILDAFNAGADGYCLKYADQSDLLAAIKSILKGSFYISPDISGQVLEGFIEGRKSLKKSSAYETLTRREKEVLKLVGEGYTSREIADLICISPKTVEKHRSNIMGKLNIHKASALSAYAVEKGLVAV